MMTVPRHFLGTTALVARLALGPIVADGGPAPSVVKLSDAEMEAIIGGQSAVDLFCTPEQLATATLMYYLTGSYLGIMLRCGASVGVDAIDIAVTEPLRQSVEYWLSTLEDDWVYQGVRYFSFVQVTGYKEYVDTIDMPFTTNVDWWGMYNANYCGDENCWCDTDWDCYSESCDEWGYCGGGGMS